MVLSSRVTLVPYDLDLINWKLINNQEKLGIKKYHQKIYETLKGQLGLNTGITLRNI